MATSDVFTEKYRVQKRVTYAIIGGGITFTFSSGIYNPHDTELMAIARARSLHCQLYSKDESGVIYEIYPERRRIEGGGRKVSYKVYPEMMGNEPVVPGIQVQSY